jgi:hypothetical protein
MDRKTVSQQVYAPFDLYIRLALKPLKYHLCTPYAIGPSQLPLKQIFLWSINFIIFLHEHQGFSTHYHHPIFPPLALHYPNLHALAVDVGEFDMHDLTHPQSTAVRRVQDQPVFQILNAREYLFDVFLIQYLGQGVGLPGTGQIISGLGQMPCFFKQELDGIHHQIQP